MREFGIDEIQAKDVGNMKLRNIGEAYIIRKIKDIEIFEAKIIESEAILGSESELNKLVILGLEETKAKYSSPRRTQIIQAGNTPKVKIVENTPDYEVTIHLTKEGYCFKYRNPNAEPWLKPTDLVIQKFTTKNNAEILVFTSDFNCRKIKINQIEDTSPASLGTFLPVIIEDKVDIIDYSVFDDKQKMLVIVYSNNKAAKINLESFEGNRKVLKKALNEKQEVLNILTLEKDTFIKFITTNKVMKLDTNQLPLTNLRSASGIYVIRDQNRKIRRAEVM